MANRQLVLIFSKCSKGYTVKNLTIPLCRHNWNVLIPQNPADQTFPLTQSQGCFDILRYLFFFN